MNLLNEFACAMTEAGKLAGITNGYSVDGKNPYSDYLSNEAWERFLKGMDPAVERQYRMGKGKELEENNGKPPKMAAFCSSSRMVYLLSKDCQDFVFEVQLPTIVGGKANLDGYLAGNDRAVYVEAKCRELYGHKFPEKISIKYRDLYRYLRAHSGGAFDCVMEEAECAQMRVAFYARGRAVVGFDIKQMICHLLGIAAKYLKETTIPKRIDFLYLLYDPRELPLRDEARSAVLDIYRETCAAALALDFEKIFAIIVDFLNEQRGIHAPDGHVESLKKAFAFRLCSQHDYRDLLK